MLQTQTPLRMTILNPRTQVPNLPLIGFFGPLNPETMIRQSHEEDKHPKAIRAFPKIGDPNIVPQIVGYLLQGPPNKVPLIFGNSHKSPRPPPEARNLEPKP